MISPSPTIQAALFDADGVVQRTKPGWLLPAIPYVSFSYNVVGECFTEDFVADYSPRVVREGRDQIEQMVKSAHSTFSGFAETVHEIIATDESIVLHFSISGTHVGDWGPVPATNKKVKYDEIVIMKVRNGKVFHQVGVTDTLLALQQMGRIPDPAGFVEKSLE